MKKNGVIYDEPISLGYNYFDGGIGLLEPHCLKPEDFDEIDKPEDYMPISDVDYVSQLKRATEAIRQNIKKMNLIFLKKIFLRFNKIRPVKARFAQGLDSAVFRICIKP